MSSPELDYSVLVPAVITSKCSEAEVPASPSNKGTFVFPCDDPQHSLCPSLFCSRGIPSTEQRKKVDLKVGEEGLQPPRMLAGKELSYLC